MHEVSATQGVPGGSLFQRTLSVGQSNGIFQDNFLEQSASVEPRDIFLPPRDIFGAAEARGLSTLPMTQDTFSQRLSMSNPEHQSSSVESRDPFFPPRDIFRANEVQNLPTDPRVHVPPSQRARGLSMAPSGFSMASRVL